MKSIRQAIDNMNAFEDKMRRQIGLDQADRQLEADVTLCEVMQALNICSKLTGLSKKQQILQRSEEAAKALVIARMALEIASDCLCNNYPPVRIERISTDYAAYTRNFGKAGYYPDPRD